MIVVVKQKSSWSVIMYFFQLYKNFLHIFYKNINTFIYDTLNQGTENILLLSRLHTNYRDLFFEAHKLPHKHNIFLQQPKII